MLTQVRAALNGDGLVSRLFQPTTVFVIMFFVNLLNYCDRGIIPGSTNEFSQFVQNTLKTETPDVYIGILQSAFIVGFAIASIAFGHLVHFYSPFFLCGVGMSIWCVAVVSSGLAVQFNSYTLLVLARCLSGVGESSMQCSIPPWIETNAGAGSKASWLGLFYCAIPVGTAFGYTYSAVVSASIGAKYAFYLEFLFMAPFIVFLFLATLKYPEIASTQLTHSHSPPALADSPASAATYTDSNTRSSTDRKSTSSINSPSQGPMDSHRPPTIMQELLNVFSSPVFVCLVLGYAAQTGSLIGISTFGSPILMGIGFFNSETEASTTFGVLVSVAGIIGSLGGGLLLDGRTKAVAFAYTEKLRLEAEAGTEGANGEEEGDQLVARRAELANANAANATGGAGLRSRSRDRSGSLNADSFASLPLLAPGPVPALVEAVVNSLYLQQACSMVWLCSIAGSVCLWSSFFILEKGLFLFIVGLGCTFIFFTTPGINLAIMRAVGHSHRSFGIAICNLLIHALGDVPSPVITGLLKDKVRAMTRLGFFFGEPRSFSASLLLR